MSVSRGASQQKNKKIILLAIAFYFNFACSNVSYLLPVYYAHAGFSAARAGALVSAFYIASLIFRLILGSFIPRFGFKKLLAAGGVLSTAGALAIVFSGGSFIPAFAARLLFGSGTAFTQIALAAYQSLAFPKEERGQAYSFIMAGGLAPMLTAVPIADALLAKGHFTAYIFIPVLLSAAMSAVTIFALDTGDVSLDDVPASASPFAGMGECLRIPAVVLSVLMMIIFSTVDAASSFMSSMTAVFGLMSSYFLSSNAAVGVLVRLFLGRVLDRYPRSRLSAPITASMAVLLLLASVHPSRTSLMILGFFFGVGMGFGFPLHIALVSDYSPRRLQPAAVSMVWFAIAVAFAVVPFVSSYITEATDPVFGFRAVVIFALVCCILTAAVWRRLERRGMLYGRRKES
ncbi:MAG: MFS transporter [Synergistes sp.]|nr:MFS transporter [Synergistes sp.]MCR5336719.1 MFS transporter [Synergistes sp.]